MPVLKHTAFCAYLVSKDYSLETENGYPSTIYSYDAAISNVLKEENITEDELAENIDAYVRLYSNGGAKEHRGMRTSSPICSALKRYRDFVEIRRNSEPLLKG